MDGSKSVNASYPLTQYLHHNNWAKKWKYSPNWAKKITSRFGIRKESAIFLSTWSCEPRVTREEVANTQREAEISEGVVQVRHWEIQKDTWYQGLPCCPAIFPPVKVTQVHSGTLSFFKVWVTPLYFSERSTLVPVFSERNPKRIFIFTKKGKRWK